MSSAHEPQDTPRAAGETLTNWRLRALEDTVKSQGEEIAGLRKVLVGFAVSVSVSSIIFALSVANFTG